MMPGKRKSDRGSRRRAIHSKIDVTAILTKSVKVGKQGREQRMSPFEVSLRALVKKALKEQSLNAIRSLLDIALQYDLVAPPPEPPLNGGVRIWPGLLDHKFGQDLYGKKSETGKDGA
jgi:hypothetical protein